MKLRIAGLMLAALALSACGFRPLYGTMGANPAGQRIFASIYVEPIVHERMGYELRNQLIDLLRGPDRAQNAAYRLEVTVTETREGVALQNDATITRYDLSFTAKYKLLDANLNVVTQGEETTLESFDVAQSPYASLTGQKEAEKRAARDISEHLQIDLGVHFAHATHA